jgi:hypothetical protein
MMKRVIVQVAATDEPVDLQERAAALSALVPGSRIERISRRGRILLAMPAEAVSAAVETFSADADVEYAEPDQVDEAQGEGLDG